MPCKGKACWTHSYFRNNKVWGRVVVAPLRLQAARKQPQKLVSALGSDPFVKFGIVLLWILGWPPDWRRLLSIIDSRWMSGAIPVEAPLEAGGCDCRNPSAFFFLWSATIPPTLHCCPEISEWWCFWTWHTEPNRTMRRRRLIVYFSSHRLTFYEPSLPPPLFCWDFVRVQFGKGLCPDKW